MPYQEGQERQSSILIEITVDDHGKIYPAYIWWCPGCDERDPGHRGTHMFHIPPWTFDNDDMEKPTFSASYLSKSYYYDGDPSEPIETRTRHETVCHSFVKDGTIQYLGDCTHSLAGQTINMVEVPDWLRHEH